MSLKFKMSTGKRKRDDISTALEGLSWGSGWSLEHKRANNDGKSLNRGKEKGNGKERKDFPNNSKLESSGFSKQVHMDMKEKGAKDYAKFLVWETENWYSTELSQRGYIWAAP